MITEEFEVKPVDRWKGQVHDFRDDLENAKGESHLCVAMDKEGNSMAHCFVLSYGGSTVGEFFNVVKHGIFSLECLVFKNNEDCIRWIELYGKERVSDFYLTR